MKIHNLKVRKLHEEEAKVEYVITGSPDNIKRHVDMLYEVEDKNFGLMCSHIIYRGAMIENNDNNIVYDSNYSGMLYNGVYIKKVIYSNPATIIIWSDGTKTSSKCQEGDTYNPETGLLLAYMKKIESSDKVMQLLKEWAPIKDKIDVTLSDVRRNNKGSHRK